MSRSDLHWVLMTRLMRIMTDDGHTDPGLVPAPVDIGTECPDCCSSYCSANISVFHTVAVLLLVYSRVGRFKSG